MKKIATILVLSAVVILGAYFGLKKMQESKKTISVSVNELIEERSSDAQPVQDEVNNEKEKEVINKPQDTVAENQQPAAIKQEEKKTSTVEPSSPDASKSSDNAGVGKILQKLISWGYTKSSDRKIDTVIVHTSYNSLGGDVYDADKIIDIYKQYDVSAHYLILRDGTIYQLVADQNISWHAGVSQMPDGRKNVNDFSIGVEVINTKDGKFTDDQYKALNSLIATLKKKYPIKYVLGHNDISPGRKTDPWGMEWDKVNR